MRFRRSILLGGLLWGMLFSLGSTSVTAAEQVRESVVAGSWYPGDAAVLQRRIETFLEKAPPSADNGRLVALIAPHAGYQYSGQVAAHAYKLLQGRSFDTVVIVAPSHSRMLPFAGCRCMTGEDTGRRSGLCRWISRL